MKTAIRHLLLFLSALLLCTACVDEDQFADNPKGNFEALWKIMDEHYCFFQEKVWTGTPSIRSMHGKSIVT